MESFPAEDTQGMSATTIVVSLLVVVVIVGVIAFTRSFRTREANDLRGSGIETHGRAVDVEKRRQMISGEIQQYATRTFEVVEFTTAEGRAVTASASNAVKNPRLNQMVRVHYDAENPERFAVD